MTLMKTSLPLSHFYRETLGTDYLSQNLQSSELLAPFQSDRITVSPAKYERYRASIEAKPRLPWGRLREYGGLNKVQLPDQFAKPRGYPPAVVQKGHRHYGSGDLDSRLNAIEQYYDITDLHKSRVRISDQVLPPSPDKNMNDRQVDLPFPAEHPYYSHVSRAALFPNFKSPDDPYTGDPCRSSSPLKTGTPASPHKVLIQSKTKGSPYRRELQDNPLEGEKAPLEWSGENYHYNLKKSPDGGKQPYYPTPPKLVHPNLRMRGEDQRIELRTANALRNLERDQWKTTYDYNYTGLGPSNVMYLDDYHKKMVEEIDSGEEKRNVSLMPATTPSFVSPRPVEGRYARLYQDRKVVKADIRYPDTTPNDDAIDVMDSREYASFPKDAGPMRRKDLWHKTPKHIEQDLKMDTTKLKKPTDDDRDAQWMTLQFSHPDHGLHLLEAEKNSEKNIDREYDKIPKNIEELIELPEKTKNYLEEYQKERIQNFKELENNHKEKELKMKYDAKRDMQALRHKVDQVGNRLAPKALDQHSMQVAKDGAKLDNLSTQLAEQFDTGLKFTTEKIVDRGGVTDLHDRQLEGYKTFPTTWRRDIATVDPPRQNHAGSLQEYIPHGNAFSMSHLPRGEANRLNTTSGSSTGSILRTPGSPSRVNRNISFDEVVRVATSEYGLEFQLHTSPLSREGEQSARTDRPLTPIHPSARSILEPSAYKDMLPVGPALRPHTADDHAGIVPSPRNHWHWNYDVRMSAEFDPLKWTPAPSVPRPQTSYVHDIQAKWNKAGSYQRFQEAFPENAPDMRDNKRLYELADESADLRFHHSIKHREKRHQFYGFNSYHFYNGNPVV